MTGAMRGGRRLEPRAGDVELGFAQLQRLPFFGEAAPGALRRLRTLAGSAAMVVRRYEPGETIIRQGAAGWTAFYLLGAADQAALGIPVLGASGDALAEVRVAQGRGGPSPESSLFERVLGGAEPAADDTLGEVVAHMDAGELFGEQSCFNHAPRSATVRAAQACHVVEMVRNVLEIALENPGFRAVLDATYRTRVLRSGLREIALFAEAPREALAFVQSAVVLESVPPGGVVFRAGDAADAVLHLRRGTLRLRAPGTDRVARYVSRGESVGLRAGLMGQPHAFTCDVYAPQMTGTRRTRQAEAELLRIPMGVLREAMDRWPELAEAAERWRAQSTPPDDQEPLAIASLAGAMGLVQAESVMLIDLHRCTRCGDCDRVCADTHGGVARLRRDGPRFGDLLVPASCRLCLDPTCLNGCPVGSIHHGADGEIVIEDWCIGCGLCVEQCPFDAIETVQRDGRRRAHTCDQCASVGTGRPLCVEACAPGALLRVDGRVFFGGGDA